MIRLAVPAGTLAAGPLRLGEREHHYLSRVRRAKVGEAVELFDGAGGAAAATISAIDAGSTTLQVGDVRRDERRGARLCAAIPVLKGERMDVCVEKLVEVGADRLVLWDASRSVVRLQGERWAARLKRLRAQVLAAAQQCGRADVPEVDGLWSLAEVVERGDAERRIALAPEAPALTASAPAGSALLVSGPEGGFAPAELERLVAAGFEVASLTDTVLRAETAPVIACGIWRWAERVWRAT